MEKLRGIEKVESQVLRNWRRLVLAVLFLFVSLLSTSAAPVNADEYMVLLQQYQTQRTGAELSGWTIKVNPTGTHFKDLYLKIRLDLYPSETSKSYVDQYVYVVDETSPEFQAGYPGRVNEFGEPLDDELYRAWIYSLPHIWRLNPALCHFVVVPRDINVEQLETFVTGKFTPDVVATIDDALVQDNSEHLISPYMRDKVYSRDLPLKTPPVLYDYYVNSINERLGEFEIVGDSEGEIQPILSQSITIGVGTGDFDSTTSSGVTYIDKGGAADGTGSIDTWKFWFNTAATGVKVATFLDNGGNNLTARDFETIGNVDSGSEQTFSGLDTDVVTGDYAGFYAATGSLERRSSGVGYWYEGGDQTEETSDFLSGASRQLAIYGTGSGDTWDIVNIPISEALGILEPSSTYYASGGAPSNPVEDGECTFTVNNTGSVTANVTIKGTNWTGGPSLTLTSGSPGENQIRITVYTSGQNPANGVVLTTSEQDFCTVNASGSLKWDFKLETGTSFTLGGNVTGNLTMTSYELIID